METSQEERDQYQDAIGTAYDEDGNPGNEFLLRLIHDANSLAAIDRELKVLSDEAEHIGYWTSTGQDDSTELARLEVHRHYARKLRAILDRSRIE